MRESHDQHGHNTRQPALCGVPVRSETQPPRKRGDNKLVEEMTGVARFAYSETALAPCS